MRPDMAKVVTEAPRYGHREKSKKTGRRLSKDEYDLDDHGPTRHPVSRKRQYVDPKQFSDVLGPLRRYLRSQVGRPWDKVHSELSQWLDRRSLTGLHIWDHIRLEVEQHAVMVGRKVYRRSRWSNELVPVEKLYVHPVTRLLRYAPYRRFRHGPIAVIAVKAKRRA